MISTIPRRCHHDIPPSILVNKYQNTISPNSRLLPFRSHLHNSRTTRNQFPWTSNLIKENPIIFSHSSPLTFVLKSLKTRTTTYPIPPSNLEHNSNSTSPDFQPDSTYKGISTNFSTLSSWCPSNLINKAQNRNNYPFRLLSYYSRPSVFQAWTAALALLSCNIDSNRNRNKYLIITPFLLHALIMVFLQPAQQNL